MSGSVDRRAHRLLAAYPWRVRTEQGDEIVATVLDALPPGAERLGWRDQLDLVRGGLRTRWQRRPPPLDVVRYRLGGTLEPVWLGWVRDDVEDPHYRRSELLRWTIAALVALSMAWVVGATVPGVDLTGVWFVPFLVLGAAGDHRRQAAVRQRHGLPPLPPAPAGPPTLRPRRRPPAPNLRVVPVAAALGLGLLATGLGALAVLGARGGAGTGPWEVVNPGDDGVSLVITGPDLVPLFVGAVAGVALLLGLVELASQPRRGQPRAGLPVALAARRLAGATSVPGALLVVAAVVLPVGTTGPVAALAGAAVPLGGLLVVAAVAVTIFERRRGAPIGLWDLFPRLWLRPEVVEA